LEKERPKKTCALGGIRLTYGSTVGSGVNSTILGIENLLRRHLRDDDGEKESL
jgi:hypothetical protein